VVPDGPDLVRPLLHARRADVLAHLARHAIPFASDPSNDDPRFARVRVRHELLPLLEDLSPAIVTHLTDLADMLQIEHHPEDELGAGTSAGPAGPAGSEALDPADLEGLLPGGLPLGRAQRLAIERARKLGRGSVRLRVAGGREIEVILPNRRAALMTPR
jgi:tRNA(Ile)-lysidine synthase